MNEWLICLIAVSAVFAIAYIFGVAMDKLRPRAPDAYAPDNAALEPGRYLEYLAPVGRVWARVTSFRVLDDGVLTYRGEDGCTYYVRSDCYVLVEVPEHD